MGYVSIEQKRKNAIRRLLWIVCGILFVAVIALGIKIMSDKGIIDFGKNENSGGSVLNSGANSTEYATEEPSATPEPYDYINEEGTTAYERFNAPEGYTKVECEEGSFGEYLRNYNLKEYGEKALYYNDKRGSGEELVYSDETSTVGVFQQQDTLTHWQQCADSIMMLYAEYLWENARYDEIVFDFYSGFRCAYSKWAEGNRVDVSGKGAWVNKAGQNGVTADDYSYETFLKYLDIIYQYANTWSLANQYGGVSYDDLMPGDFIVADIDQLKEAAAEVSDAHAESISYGHAMVVVDVAVNAEGHKVFMLAEGNTPATEVAVVENPDKSMSVWFEIDENGRFAKSTSGILWRVEWFHSFKNFG